MAIISRLLLRVALIALALSACEHLAQAQYAMSLRFDTVAANPGDTVILNVYYKFTSKMPSQPVQDFDVKYEYDTSEIYAFDYILDGTASANMFILDTSHHGILVANGFLDFSNPVLFKIRFRVNKKLADTAFIRWDTGVSVFEYSDSIAATEQDGWIKTPSSFGHVTLSTPSITIDTGRIFSIPVSISGIENAKIDSALLRFEIDTSRFPFRGASGGFAFNAVVQSSSASGDTVSIILKSVKGNIENSDSLVIISFYSFPWYDTACVILQDVRFVALNSGSFIGNTASSTGSVCVVPGSKAHEYVTPIKDQHNKLSVYPNPARDLVTFDAGDGNTGRVTIDIYDQLGRRTILTSNAYPVWQIPSNIRTGVYFITVNTKTGRYSTSLFIEP